MSAYKYTANAWGYYHTGNAFSAGELAGRICGLGFDGFDLLIGPESFPALAVDADAKQLSAIRQAAESAGGAIASIVLVGFGLQDEGACQCQLEQAPRLAGLLGTKTVHLLPRKIGIPHVEGFRRLAGIWKRHGKRLLDAGLLVTAENHVWTQNADEDIFLVRLSRDFDRLLEATGGQAQIKFDPAWLLMPGAEEDPVTAFKRLLPNIRILDLKDYSGGKFVAPGTGQVNFPDLAHLAANSRIASLAVEVEQHHSRTPPLTDPLAIDILHKEALAYYKDIFG